MFSSNTVSFVMSREMLEQKNAQEQNYAPKLGQLFWTFHPWFFSAGDSSPMCSVFAYPFLWKNKGHLPLKSCRIFGFRKQIIDQQMRCVYLICCPLVFSTLYIHQRASIVKTCSEITRKTLQNVRTSLGTRMQNAKRVITEQC